MSKITINIEQSDIHTIIKDNRIIIECDNNIDLVFTKEALEELLNDYNTLKNTQHEI
jgi:hypothetical protein